VHGLELLDRDERVDRRRPLTEHLKTRVEARQACDNGQVGAHAAGARLAAEASGSDKDHLGGQLAVAEVHLLCVRAGGGSEQRGPATQ